MKVDNAHLTPNERDRAIMRISLGTGEPDLDRIVGDRIERRIRMLEKTVEDLLTVVAGLAEQQAMPDDWYLVGVDSARAVLHERWLWPST